jgi:hypothetical protein
MKLLTVVRCNVAQVYVIPEIFILMGKKMVIIMRRLIMLYPVMHHADFTNAVLTAKYQKVS